MKSNRKITAWMLAFIMITANVLAIGPMVTEVYSWVDSATITTLIDEVPNIERGDLAQTPPGYHDECGLTVKSGEQSFSLNYQFSGSGMIDHEAAYTFEFFILNEHSTYIDINGNEVKFNLENLDPSLLNKTKPYYSTTCTHEEFIKAKDYKLTVDFTEDLQENSIVYSLVKYGKGSQKLFNTVTNITVVPADSSFTLTRPGGKTDEIRLYPNKELPNPIPNLTAELKTPEDVCTLSGEYSDVVRVQVIDRDTGVVVGELDKVTDVLQLPRDKEVYNFDIVPSMYGYEGVPIATLAQISAPETGVSDDTIFNVNEEEVRFDSNYETAVELLTNKATITIPSPEYFQYLRINSTDIAVPEGATSVEVDMPTEIQYYNLEFGYGLKDSGLTSQVYTPSFRKKGDGLDTSLESILAINASTAKILSFDIDKEVEEDKKGKAATLIFEPVMKTCDWEVRVLDTEEDNDGHMNGNTTVTDTLTGKPINYTYKAEEGSKGTLLLKGTDSFTLTYSDLKVTFSRTPALEVVFKPDVVDAQLVVNKTEPTSTNLVKYTEVTITDKDESLSGILDWEAFEGLVTDATGTACSPPLNFNKTTKGTLYFRSNTGTLINRTKYSFATNAIERVALDAIMARLSALLPEDYAKFTFEQMTKTLTEAKEKLNIIPPPIQGEINLMFKSLEAAESKLINISGIKTMKKEALDFIATCNIGIQREEYHQSSVDALNEIIRVYGSLSDEPEFSASLVSTVKAEILMALNVLKSSRVAIGNIKPYMLTFAYQEIDNEFRELEEQFSPSSWKAFVDVLAEVDGFIKTSAATAPQNLLDSSYFTLIDSVKLLSATEKEKPTVKINSITSYSDPKKLKVSFTVQDNLMLGNVLVSASDGTTDVKLIDVSSAGTNSISKQYAILFTTADKTLRGTVLDISNNKLDFSIDMQQAFDDKTWKPDASTIRIDGDKEDPDPNPDPDPDPNPDPDPDPDPDPNVEWSFNNPIFNSGRYSTLASSLPLVITVDVPYPTTKTRAANEFILKVGEGVQSNVSYGAATATAKLTFTQPTDISIGFELAKGSTSLGLKKVRFIVEKAGNGGGGTTPNPDDKPDKVIKGLLDTDTLIYGIDALDKGGILDVNIKTNYRIHGDVLRYLKGQQKALALYDDYDGYTYILKGTDISRVRLDSSDVLDLRPIISDYYWNTELKDIVGKDYMHIGFDFMQPGFRSTFGVATEWNAKNLYAYSVIDSDKKEFELVWEGKTTSRGLAEFQLEYFGDVILTPVRIADKYVIGKNGSGSGTSSDGSGGGSGGTGNGTSSGSTSGTIPVDTVGTKPKPPSNNPQTGGLTERYVFGNVLETNRQTRKLNLSVVALMLTINTLGAIAIVMLTKGVPVVRGKGKKTRVRNSMV